MPTKNLIHYCIYIFRKKTKTKKKQGFSLPNPVFNRYTPVH